MTDRTLIALTTPIIQVANDGVAAAFRRWAVEQFRAGAQMVLLEGLPQAGKSRIIDALRSDPPPWRLVELDEVLPNPAPSDQPWDELVERRFPFAQVEADLAAGRKVVIEGPAVGLLLPRWSNLGSIRRAYLRKISVSGGEQRWVDSIGMLDHAEDSGRFWRSIYRHHACDEPWKHADVVIDRLDEERS